MTKTDEINAEIRNQAVRLYPKCAGNGTGHCKGHL